MIAPEGGTISKTLGGIETSAGRGQPIQNAGKEQRIQEPREKRTGIAQEGGNLSKSLGGSRGDYRLAQDGANYPRAWGVTG